MFWYELCTTAFPLRWTSVTVCGCWYISCDWWVFFLGLVVDGVYHSKKKILHRIWGKQSCWKVEACAVSGSWDLTQYHKRQITWTKPVLHLKAPLPHSWTASPPITCQSSWRDAYLQMTSKKVGKCSQSERFNHLSSVDILVNCFSSFLLYWYSKYI